MDAIIYGAALGLGYAGYENIPYIFSLKDYDSMWGMVVARVFPTIMHLGVGIIMGTFVSMNLFRQWDEFKRRLQNDTIEKELEESIKQVKQIAYFRLNEIIDEQ